MRQFPPDGILLTKSQSKLNKWTLPGKTNDIKEQLASLPEKCSFTTARPFDKLRNFRSRIVDKANKAQ
jgi:hypothetical protein